MDRKTFIKKTVGALLLALPAYAIIGCSGSDDSGSYNSNSGGAYGGGFSGGTDPNCLENGARASSISGNHGHSLTVSSSDVNAGIEKTYSIQGSAVHVHNVTVSVADFNSLKINQQISVISTSGDSHTHSVVISCV